jgi:FkbM family methyltransferase
VTRRRTSLRDRIVWLLTRGLAEGRELLAVAKCRELAPRGRLSLIAAKVMYHTGKLSRDTVVDCRVAGVWFGRESFSVDWYVFEEIFIRRIYDEIAFQGACVLDLGAHKGYFAAFALNHGAARVVSFEPEAENFRRLASAAQGVPGWTVRREAVAGESGVRTLRLKEAWSHSLVGSAPTAATASAGIDGGNSITVPVVGFAEILSAYDGQRVAACGQRLVLKLDIEGAECEALAGARIELLARVDELVVEAHIDAPCRPADIIVIAEAAGLRGMKLDLSHPAPLLHFVRCESGRA